MIVLSTAVDSTPGTLSTVVRGSVLLELWNDAHNVGEDGLREGWRGRNSGQVNEQNK